MEQKIYVRRLTEGRDIEAKHVVDETNNVKYRVGQLEKCYETLDGKIDKIMNNHLQHLNLEVAKLGTKINVMSSINLLAIIGLIVTIVTVLA